MVWGEMAAKVALGGLLLFDSLEGVQKRTNHIGHERHKIGGHGVHGRQSLSKQLFLGRQLGEIGHLSGGQGLAVEAGLTDLNLAVGLGFFCCCWCWCCR